MYSNSSSAPNSASSTFLRRPSDRASATAPPTTPSSRSAAEAAAALLLLGRLVQGDAGVAHVAGGLLDVLLQLLVVEDLLGRALAVAQPRVRVTGRLVGLDDVLAQILVVDQPLDVRVGAGRLSRLPGLLHLLVRHRSLARRFLKIGLAGPSIPGSAVCECGVEHIADLRRPKRTRGSCAAARGCPRGRGSLRLGASTRRDARALGGERLLLEAADRQHLAGQRELAGHRHVVAHGAPGDAATSARWPS